MNSFLAPFENINDLLVFNRLCVMNNKIEIETIIDLLNEYTGKNYQKFDIIHYLLSKNIMPMLDPSHFFENNEKLDYFIKDFLGKTFSTKHVNCIFCPENILKIFNSFKAVVYSYNSGGNNCTYIVKLCQKCKTKFYLNFYSTKNGERIFYDNCLDSNFFSFSNELIFDDRLLKKLSSDIIFKHSSFKAFANSFNYFHLITSGNKTKVLQEKRLTEIWFYYNFLKTKLNLEKVNDVTAFYVDQLNINLEKINYKIFQIFCEKWSGKIHHENCRKIDCCKVIGIDGNYKINRLRCMFPLVKLECKELDNILIGCPKTPKRKSYYCEEHMSIDEQVSFNYGNKIFKCNISQINPRIGKIATENLNIYDSFINRKDSVLYLVGYDNILPFWVTEKQVPKSIKENYLKNFNQSENQNCQTLKSLSLPCEKKNRTVGEFLAVYNCGIICGFREIYGSESLSQGLNFLLDLYDSIEKKSNFIMYDDGCHLKQFIDSSEKIKTKTVRLVELRSKTMIVDRFHYKGHKKSSEYCKIKCNPENYHELKGINTSVVEQINFWFSGFKHIAKHMNKERFKFFVFVICDEFNEANLNYKILKNLTNL